MTPVDILVYYALIKYGVWAMAEVGALLIAFACGELSGMRYRKD